MNIVVGVCARASSITAVAPAYVGRTPEKAELGTCGNMGQDARLFRRLSQILVAVASKRIS
jgi:hypothetical protein